jgi:aminoglycoside phosphotransferase (APT) family kinase protein
MRRVVPPAAHNRRPRSPELDWLIGWPEVVAVLDWELSTIGSVWADAALLILPFYVDLGPIGNLHDIDLDAHGLPGRDQVLEWYCDERGVSAPDNLDLLLVFDLFRCSSVNYGVGGRGRRGLTPSPQAPEFGVAAGRIAARARELVESGSLSL